ncbi:hypothetical protein [Halorientalis pallida]|uniref:Uncharacterized protein n=1 Tax=Halorientalis pallida TaxID=2479928 RepID=A0A498L920_9EURY|nr:hypothetical protein [Halorientalis pallida]RXK51643.1 hypothetical protein EAF64_03150 [Halorientalis pallida]
MTRSRTAGRPWLTRVVLAAVLGMYGGSVVVLRFVALTDRIAPAAAALAPAGLAVVGVAVVAVTVPNLAVVLARTRLHYALFSVPAAVFLAHGWVEYVTVGPELPVTVRTLVLGLIAFALAGVAVLIDNRALADRIAAGQEPAASWRARPSRRVARRQLSLYVLAGAPIVAGSAVGLLTLDAAFLVVGTALSGILTSWLNATTQARTYEAYPDGLVIDPDNFPKPVPWSRLSGYSRTDDTLVLHRRCRGPIRCSRGEIDDLDAVVRVLNRHLSARDTAGDRP